MRVLGIVLLTLVLMPLASPTPAALADCPGNILANPGFEEGFSERGAGEVTVANGWTPFWDPGPLSIGGHECGNMRPEFKGEDGARYGYRRIHEGHWAQKWFNSYGHHRAGIYQQVNVATGSKLSFSAWVEAWSSQADDPAISTDGGYTAKIGIDPTGGTDRNSPNVVWSPDSQPLDTWVQLKVEATAKAGTITVFLFGEPQWCLKHNDVYFDDTCLVAQAPPPPPTARPQPTNTPAPTNTPEPTPTDTPPPSPTPTDTPEATPTPIVGAIRVLTFEDRNGNGTRDAGEPLLVGAQVALTNRQRAPIASKMSVGDSQFVTFEGLQPGNYIVEEQDPPGYVSTSPNQCAVTVVGGSTLELYFADRFEPSPTPTRQPEPTQAPVQLPAEQPPAPPPSYQPLQPSGNVFESFYNISGILLAAFALILPFGLKALRDRL